MTATAGLELTNPAAYQAKMIGLLGDRDPLEVLRTTPGVLAGIVQARPAEVFARRPFPGKWTPNEIIGHLIDCEWVYGYRIRAIYCEEAPTILGMDQEIWVTRQRYNEWKTADLIETYRALRGLNWRLWSAMTPEDLRRVGRHNERGDESLGLMLRMEAGHDLSHIDQFQRYVAAAEAMRG